MEYTGNLYVSQRGLQINRRPEKTIFMECIDAQEEVDIKVLMVKYMESGSILIKKMRGV